MKCSVCGTDCADSTRYCPTCGTPLQSAPQTQAMPVQQDSYVPAAHYAPQAQAQPSQPFPAQQPAYEPTRQMPPYQQPSGQFPRAGASTEFQAVPVNSAIPGRSVDMSAATKSPKWPIILIAVLVVVIVALVLWILHPWDSGAQSGTADVVGGSVVVTSSGDGSSTQAAGTDAGQAAGTVGEQAAAQTAGTVGEQPAATTQADAYTQLTASYDQLDGFHNQISSVASDFSDNVGVNDLTDIRNRAADLQQQIQAARSTLQAISVQDGSTYAQTKAAIDNLYNDLEMRIAVLVEACDAQMSGGDYSAILGRDNGAADEHGHTNKYLIDYEQNYSAAKPVQA